MTGAEAHEFVLTLDTFEKKLFHEAAQSSLPAIIRNHQGSKSEDLTETVVVGAFMVAAEYVKMTREYNL